MYPHNIELMDRSPEQIANDIAAFQPHGGDWLKLNALLEELWRDDDPVSYISLLLNVFERYPESDGGGVFMGILHGVESLPGYQPLLLQSVQCVPSIFGTMMLGRLLNAGVTEIEGVSVPQVLQSIAASSPGSGAGRTAAAFLSRQPGS